MPTQSFSMGVMLASLAVVVLSYALIARKDRSWIHWATPIYLFLIAANYLLPGAALLVSGPTGSEYAYLYVYSTYALVALSGALTYTLVKPPRIPDAVVPARAQVGMLPWLLLGIGIALYLPVMIEFRHLLLHPREIYIQTRTGYGLWFFGSTAFANLAFVTYLFKRNKSLAGALVFFPVCVALIFLHGTKGQLLTLVLITVLYRVYVQGKRLSLVRAFAALLVFAVIGLGLFAVFADFSDAAELLTFIRDYSDYTRNAMMVIDDPAATPYGGRLTLESEIYSRIPRAVMPDKPKDFGTFKLARTYYPAWYREDTGSPDFGIGLQYADFGWLAILVLCCWSALSAWLVAGVLAALRARPHPSLFLLLLLFANVVVVPSGSSYPLPETVILATVIALVMRFRLLPHSSPRFQWRMRSIAPSALGR